MCRRMVTWATLALRTQQEYVSSQRRRRKRRRGRECQMMGRSRSTQDPIMNMSLLLKSIFFSFLHFFYSIIYMYIQHNVIYCIWFSFLILYQDLRSPQIRSLSCYPCTLYSFIFFLILPLFLILFVLFLFILPRPTSSLFLFFFLLLLCPSWWEEGS